MMCLGPSWTLCSCVAGSRCECKMGNWYDGISNWGKILSKQIKYSKVNVNIQFQIWHVNCLEVIICCLQNKRGKLKVNNFYCCYSVTQLCLTLWPQWTAACQASSSFIISQSLLKLMCIASVRPSNHLILCHHLLLLPSIVPSITVFSNESTLCIRWPKYWNFSFSISPSNEITFMDTS